MAMHVNVRKDICFPSACIRFERTQRHICAICTWCLSDASPRNEHACERVHVCDKCALQLHANASERTSVRHMTLFLTRCHYCFTLTFCRASLEKKSKSNETTSRRQSYTQLLLDYTFCTRSKKIMKIWLRKKFWKKNSEYTQFCIIQNSSLSSSFKVYMSNWSNLKFLCL